MSISSYMYYLALELLCECDLCTFDIALVSLILIFQNCLIPNSVLYLGRICLEKYTFREFHTFSIGFRAGLSGGGGGGGLVTSQYDA